MDKTQQPQTTNFAVAEATKDNSAKLLQSVIADQQPKAAPPTRAELVEMAKAIQQQARGAAPLDDPDTEQNPADDGTDADTLPRIDFADLTAPAWETDPLGDIANYFAAPKKTNTWGLMGGRPALPRKGVIVIDAKPKQGKSLSHLALAVALLGKTEQFGNFTPIEPRPNGIIIADTEMADDVINCRGLGVCNTIGDVASRRLVTLQLSKYSAAERWERLQKYVTIYNPQIVVVDNLTNMLPNVNDQEAATAICTQLAAMAVDRTIIAVIHQNKRAEDTNTTGALGSKLDQMTDERYTAKQQRGVFYLMPTMSRIRPVPDEPDDRQQLSLMFSVAQSDDPENQLGIAKFVDGRAEAARAAEEQAADRAAGWRKEFAQIFATAGVDALQYSQLIQRLMAAHGYSEQSAKNAIKNATEAGAIAKAGAGKFAPYKMVLLSNTPIVK